MLPQARCTASVRCVRLQFRAIWGLLFEVGVAVSLCIASVPTIAAADSPIRPAPRRLATPMRFGEIVRLLDDPDYAVRLEAVRRLELLNRPASETVPPLVRRFDDPDLRVRIHAVRVAIRAGMPVQYGIKAAAGCLVPEYPDVCCLAANILADAGPAAAEALPQLGACQSAESPRVRLHAARAAVRVDPADSKAIQTARAALHSEPADEREFAAGILAESRTGLTEQLRDSDPAARREDSAVGTPPEGVASRHAVGESRWTSRVAAPGSWRALPESGLSGCVSGEGVGDG